MNADVKEIWCKMCKRITVHQQLINGMWKCFYCGEYNVKGTHHDYN